MKKVVLAGVSLLAVGLLILGSQTNVVGYQTVQASQQNLLKERINQKEFLFQTICDLTNNKDIQKVILTSQLNSGYFTPGMKTLSINIPVLTKRQLEFAYHLGLLLSKSMSKTEMFSLIKQHQTLTSGNQPKIDAVIKNDSKLTDEINQLSLLNCNCNNQNTFQWFHPVICFILVMLILYVGHLSLPYDWMITLCYKLNCLWTHLPPEP